MARRVIMLIGMSGSGKSTLANKISRETGVAVICPDEIRKELYGDISVSARVKVKV
ncbi:MAG: ATP-binding protein [Lachnospiraceae bacterium]|nr:ATP-binding protein [Lachnospiraceae bacterium]